MRDGGKLDFSGSRSTAVVCQNGPVVLLTSSLPAQRQGEPIVLYMALKV